MTPLHRVALVLTDAFVKAYQSSQHTKEEQVLLVWTFSEMMRLVVLLANTVQSFHDLLPLLHEYENFHKEDQRGRTEQYNVDSNGKYSDHVDQRCEASAQDVKQFTKVMCQPIEVCQP